MAKFSPRTLAWALSGLLLSAASGAHAHAQLDKAVPPVGGQVSAPAEIRLKFTEALEARFSSVALASSSGESEPLGPLTLDPADKSVAVVKIGKTLPPGQYVVKWRAVSVDTHRTQGSFTFTVKP